MPLLIDLCCGRGGWSKGFMQHGWRARGYDIKPQPDYPGEFVQADLMQLTEQDIADGDFICASTPCEQFSVHCMKHFHKSPPFPDMGIRLFLRAQALCILTGKLYLMENVRCAQQFVGPAVQHCGPFYLWGNAVPAIMPPQIYKIVKGCTQRTRAQAAKLGISYKSDNRTASAKVRAGMVSNIPLQLAEYLAQVVTALFRAGVDPAASLV